MLVTVSLVELIEGFIWQDEPVSIVYADSHVCSRRNQALTLVIVLGLLPWQPFLVICPCRRVGEARNRDLLQVPEGMAFLFGVAVSVTYVLTQILGPPFFVTRSIMVEVPNLQDDLSHRYYKNLFHTQTCSFVGESGRHLHWTMALADTWWTPNGWTYMMLWLSVVVARPWAFASGIITAIMVLFLTLVVQFEGSFEAGSVWCWSAVVFSSYFVVQPYIFPCKPSITTHSEHNESVKSAP